MNKISFGYNYDERIKDLRSLNMSYNGESFIGNDKINDDFNVHYTEIICSNEDEWNIIINKLKKELKKRELLKKGIKN